MKKALKALAISMLLATTAVTSMPVTALANVRLEMVGGIEGYGVSHRFEIEHPNLIGEIDGILIFMVDDNVESLSGDIHFTEMIRMGETYNVDVDGTFNITPSVMPDEISFAIYHNSMEIDDNNFDWHSVTVDTSATSESSNGNNTSGYAGIYGPNFYYALLTPDIVDMVLSEGKLEYGMFGELPEPPYDMVWMGKELKGLPELIMVAKGDTPATTVTPITDEVKVIINGQPQSFEVSPQIINGRTMLPLRAIGEALGMNVDFNAETNTAILTKGNLSIEHTINTSEVSINGTVQTFDTSSTIIGSRTLMPIRMLAEAIGAEVNWDETTRTTTITTN